MDSPLRQQFTGILVVAGTIRGDENSGVQVEVIGPDNAVVFGPRFVNTDYEGSFSADVPIRVPGEYEVSFTDAKGFIGTRIITVPGAQTPVASLSVAAAPGTVVSDTVSVSPTVPAPLATGGPGTAGGLPAVSPVPFLGLAALGIALLLRR